VIISAILFLSVYFAVLMPWYIRNYIKYNELGFTTMQGYNLLFYSVCITEVKKTEKPVKQIQTEIKDKNPRHAPLQL